jgi:hypothetical protein
LISFSLFTFPSTRPLFWGRVSPATTAALSRSTRLHKALECAYLAGGAFRQPRLQFLCFPVMKHVPKFWNELIGQSSRLARLTNGSEGFLLLLDPRESGSRACQPDRVMGAKVLEGSMRDFRLPKNAPLHTPRPHTALDGLSRSLLSLRLDLLAKVQAVRTPLLPSREHLLGTGVEDAPSLICAARVSGKSPSLIHRWRVLLLNPTRREISVEPRPCSERAINGTRAVVALLTTTEAGAFSTQFWRRLPVFHAHHFRTL